MTSELRSALGASGLDVFPLAFGSGGLGWTNDDASSFELLDAYTAAGGNFVDSADVYSAWAPGNSGGESETMIGKWLRARGNRAEVVITSKVGRHPEFPGLAAKNIHAAVDASLARLGVEHIDLYFAHYDDPDTPIAERAEAFSSLIDSGKVRAIGASNYSAERLTEWLRAIDEGGFHPLSAFQPHYNLMERDYETDTLSIVEKAGLGVVPYSPLATGFLTGKYRGGAAVESRRAGTASQYVGERGDRVLAALDTVAAAHGVAVATVALAWLAAQPSVVAPITGASAPDQLPSLLDSVTLKLTGDEVAALSAASA